MAPLERLLRFCLFLYPAPFRDRFGAEWREIMEWRARTEMSRSFGKLRFAAVVVGDSLRGLSTAHFASFTEKLRRATHRAGGGGSSDPERNRSGHTGRGWGTAIEHLVADLRYAARGLRRSPLFTAAAVISLGLGVGANTAIFSVVNAVLIRPLPYENPDRLAFVWNEFQSAGLARLPMSGVEIAALREETSVFESVGGIWATSRTVLRENGPLQVSAALVTANFFSVLGVAPAAGRWFDPNDPQTDAASVMVSHRFWVTELGADPDVIGSSIRLGSGDGVIIGVMPRDFKLLFPTDAGIPEQLDVFVPLGVAVGVLPPDQQFLRTVGRLRPGVTIEQGQAAVSSAARRVRETYAALAVSQDHFTLVSLQGDAVRTIRPVLLALMGGVALFLLLAAVNVAGLLLARMTTRGRDFAIRSCIGASTGRIVQQLVAESLLITMLGGVVGLFAGWWGVKFLWLLRPDGLTGIDEVGLDPLVLSFTLVAVAVASLVFGLAPLTQVSRLQPFHTLRHSFAHGSRGNQRARRVVTAVEVALALVLVVGAGLMAQTFARLQRVDVGFQPGRLLTFRVSLSERLFSAAEERNRLAQQIENEVAALPGVAVVGAGSHMPFVKWANWSDAAPPEGTAEEDRQTFHFDHRSITPGYFQAIGARTVEGRLFEQHDDGAHEPVIIVDQACAARVFPGQSAVGKRLQASRYVDGDFVPTWATVVGVIADIRDRSPATGSMGQVYWPFAQSARWELTYAVRAEGDPLVLIDAVRDAVVGVRPELAPSNFAVMDQYLDEVTAGSRFTALLATIFSGVALALATVGLYGVIAFATIQRGKEIGLRIALGASRPRILGGVVADGLKLCLLGVGAGLVSAVALTRFIQGLLFGVSATDPATFAAVAALFVGISLAASFIPARRAATVNPVESLRSE